LETMLQSAGRAGDTIIIYTPSRQLEGLGCRP